jgi:hypothetical protein
VKDIPPQQEIKDNGAWVDVGVTVGVTVGVGVGVGVGHKLLPVVAVKQSTHSLYSVNALYT